MSDITLSSKEYCESVFVDGPKFDKLSAFVSGPDAQLQGKLTAGTGINLNNNTISVNTASSVGTSTLPVTALAVNTKLGDYVANIQADADCPVIVSRSGSLITLSPNGSGGNYVPLGSYGSYQQYGALPIGANSTAIGYGSTAAGDDSAARGSYSMALGISSKAASGNSMASGSSSTASSENSTALGICSTASGYGSTASGNSSVASGGGSTASGEYSTASGDGSTALGRHSTASGELAQTFGSYGRNANDCCTVIAAINGDASDCYEDINYVTQLYLIPKGSPLATQYEDGEACLGYVTVDSNWTKIASGTKKLSELLNNNVNTFAPNLTQER